MINLPHTATAYMSTRERHTNAQERADSFSSKNGSSEKTAATEKKDYPRILNFRRILIGMTLLSLLGVGGLVYGERNRDLNKELREAHKLCETTKKDAAQILCDFKIELGRLKEIQLQENSDLIISINVNKNGLELIDSYQHLKLNENDPTEVRAFIDETIAKIDVVMDIPGINVSNYVIYMKRFKSEDPSKPGLFIVKQDYTGSAGVDAKGEKVKTSRYLSEFDKYVTGVNGGVFPSSTLSFLHTAIGSNAGDGPYGDYPGFGGRLAVTPQHHSQLINQYLNHLRPWEQELYLDWIKAHPIKYNE